LVDFTILMPCLNEENTIGMCVSEAFQYLKSHNINGEVLIADNGSTDNSVNLALSLGARVIHVKEKGYGNALHNGIMAANGRYVIYADCDYSYDFSKLDAFVDGMQKGFDIVIGNRYSGKMEKSAMPFSHKYIGVPMLSLLTSIRYRIPLHDYFCGLRAVNKEVYSNLTFNSSGMEYAIEMIERFAKNKSYIKSVPIDFRKDRRGRKPHLNSLKDGLRTLKLILMV